MNELVQVGWIIKLGKSLTDRHVVLETLTYHLEVWIVPLVAVAKLGVRVEVAEKLEHFDRTYAHFWSEVRIGAAHNQNEILDDLGRVHVTLKHHFLLLHQVKVLSHEQTHCKGVQSEALADILERGTNEQIALLGHLGEVTRKVAALLLLQRLQVLRRPRSVLVDHELRERSEVSNHSIAVFLEVGRDKLEVSVPLLLRTE